MSEDFDSNFSTTQKQSGFLQKLGKLIAIIFAPLMFLLSFLPRKLRIIVVIIGVTALIISLLVLSRPQAQKRAIPETVVTVEVVEAKRQDYPILVNTNGTIQADTRGNLVSQIRGEIVKVSNQFNNGGSFNAGDVLIEVDDRDYRAEVSQALSAVSQAKAALRQEQALAKQAKTDWLRLGNEGNPPSLVGRDPQLAAARAQLDSAQARYETAQLNLERTKIKAPYTGRVISRIAVLGQYVSIGSNLAEIFATEGVEVRLPISQEEYAQLGLDELGLKTQKQPFNVVVSSQLGALTHTWDAVVTRTDSTFDLTTRQIDVVAEVVDPFSQDGTKPSLKIGQFVNAQIQGRTLTNVIAVPNKSLREGSYVFTSRDNKLVRTPVKLSWQDDLNAVITDGIDEGDIVVITSLNSTLAGARVKYQGSDADSPQSKTAITDTEISKDAAASSPPDGNPVTSSASAVNRSANNQ